ncbi:MAG: helix-turn-helix transcriptional regulator [Gemmatimonadetes bacterium]|nr:helix-turn-helix transcriptional regulator [Gemmatimonadota bacterium]
MNTDAEVGKYIARLRDKAGLKQNELAQKVTWSPAVLSRVESGERPLVADELNSILEAIGTKEALRFQETAERDWQKLQKPPLGHPNEPLLWDAEQALQNIEELSAKPDIKNVFVKRLEAFQDELKIATSLVLETEHTIAFVGDIGVGKSTAICSVADLEVQKGKTFVPVLEVGGGGVTVCEVHLVQGPQYGFTVEPMGENELRREVLEFAHFLLPSADTHHEEQVGDQDAHGTSKEIVRAIRNMSGLTIKRKVRTKQGPGSKKIREIQDPAKDLAERYADPNTLAAEILAKMDLQKRTRRELWYSEISSEESLLWLQKNFEQVNNGRHPEFSIPKRIDITVPQRILGEESLFIRVVDTKGIDSTAERRDLEKHFNAPNTIVVLCSYFNNAPSNSVQQLLERAKEGQCANLETKTAVLTLPRPNEALAVKDDSGFKAETVDEGYDLKGDQVEMRLIDLNVPDVRVEFFNSYEDEPEHLSIFLLKLVNGLREKHCENLKKAIDGANDLVQNSEKAQVQEIQQQAARRLLVWKKHNEQIDPFTKNLQDSLLSAIGRAYASSVQASVRRQGEWYNLDYAHQLGYGARATAAGAVGPKLEAFKMVAENLLQDPELEEAFSLVRQALWIIESGAESLFHKSQELGRTIHTEYMQFDAELWYSCIREWGAGSGYRGRVLAHHQDWFASDTEDIVAIAQALIELVAREWKKILETLSDILDVKEDEQ